MERLAQVTDPGGRGYTGQREHTCCPTHWTRRAGDCAGRVPLCGSAGLHVDCDPRGDACTAPPIVADYIKASNTGAGDHFGPLALSLDGATLAVGAWKESNAAGGVNGDQNNDDAPGSGAVYVYDPAPRTAGRSRRT